jgi:hypothetical protein
MCIGRRWQRQNGRGGTWLDRPKGAAILPQLFSPVSGIRGTTDLKLIEPRLIEVSADTIGALIASAKTIKTC